MQEKRTLGREQQPSEKPSESPAQAAPSNEEPPAPALSKSRFDHLPRLSADPAFWGMTGTQFFGAFNDNLFKQLLLLLTVPVVLTADQSTADQQWLIGLLFAIPFIMFSGFAGFLSERFSKRNVIVISKCSEILVMCAGVAAFVAYNFVGLGALLAVLFLMAAQSAFFGPGKYGVLPEMFRGTDLPRANGIILMTTFLAIIFGQALAGILKDQFEGRLWIASLICVGVAVTGMLTSLLLRRTPPARPDLKFDAGSLAIPRDVRTLLRNDRPLLYAILVSCVFWLCGGMGLPAINSLGKEQLVQGSQLDDTYTGILAASVGVGTAIGCVVAGMASGSRANFRLSRFGNWGIVICLALLSVPHLNDGGRQLLGYWGSLAALLMLGVCTGFFMVPLNVFLQSRPPSGQKGRIIATMNLTNWIALAISALLYLGYDRGSFIAVKSS